MTDAATTVARPLASFLGTRFNVAPPVARSFAIRRRIRRARSLPPSRSRLHFGSRTVCTTVLRPGNCSSCQATTKVPCGRRPRPALRLDRLREPPAVRSGVRPRRWNYRSRQRRRHARWHPTTDRIDTLALATGSEPHLVRHRATAAIESNRGPNLRPSGLIANSMRGRPSVPLGVPGQIDEAAVVHRDTAAAVRHARSSSGRPWTRAAGPSDRPPSPTCRRPCRGCCQETPCATRRRSLPLARGDVRSGNRRRFRRRRASSCAPRASRGPRGARDKCRPCSVHRGCRSTRRGRFRRAPRQSSNECEIARSSLTRRGASNVRPVERNRESLRSDANRPPAGTGLGETTTDDLVAPTNRDTGRLMKDSRLSLRD